MRRRLRSAPFFLDLEPMPNRRFPPPWTVQRLPGGFKVVDASGQSLAYFYAARTRMMPTWPRLCRLPPLDCLAILFAMRRASSSEIFLVRQGTGESVMTFWLVASA